MKIIHKKIFKEMLRDRGFPCKRLEDSIQALTRACNLVVNDSKALWYQELKDSLAEYLERFPQQRENKKTSRKFYEDSAKNYLRKAKKDFSFSIGTPYDILSEHYGGTIDLEFWRRIECYGHKKIYESLTSRIEHLNNILNLHRKKPIEFISGEELNLEERYIEKGEEGEELDKIEKIYRSLGEKYKHHVNWIVRNCLTAYISTEPTLDLFKGFLDLTNTHDHRIKHIYIPLLGL